MDITSNWWWMFFFAHEYHQQMMIDGNLLKNVVVKMEIVKRQLMFCLFNGDTFTFWEWAQVVRCSMADWMEIRAEVSVDVEIKKQIGRDHTITCLPQSTRSLQH